ncbi:PREDICTED: E3 ubiquitin-protein ligase ZFP91-like isoform X2 [Cyprinodon variegatus]|uniref:E3 ubiquitin-protein ligase ZFP91-like isoform X2 n=1 Tax=Cyprinodon variegatus TaxID=28743 RepID=UPI000742A538|nr:PREDICTED: E3 ubiquitin-protein ligase ZFP91-like isoform X2 [Cyprinodon variegatus]
MEPAGNRTGDVNKDEEPKEDRAAKETPASSTIGTQRRALRDRGAGRPRSGVSSSAAEVNGAASSASGRVLRDRSTRAVPAWLKDSKSDEEEDEPSPDSSAAKRRKVSSSRRRKGADAAGQVEAGEGLTGDSLQGTDCEDPKRAASHVQAPLPKQPPAQNNARSPAGRAARSATKAVCKTEPEMEAPAVEDGCTDKEKCDSEKTEDDGKEGAEQALDIEAIPYQDDSNDFSYQPQSQSSVDDEEDGLSSDEDVPFRDDLNDQSYDPRAERFLDLPKPKRKVPPRQKDKKEKDKAPKKEKEASEIKVEGSDNLEVVQEEVKLEEEVAEDPDGPRKRGRRKKDDKTPRLPKRRKKPPVQYVRCEIEGCGTVLAHPRYLQHHIKYQHLLKKKYVCPHPSCGRLFRLQKQLLRHAKHHTDQRDYICEFCARAFKSSHNLAVHRMIHTGEKPLQCEICGFTCRQKASLNWHMKKHDADATYQFSCSICGKKFEKKDCVVAHKAKSHPEVLIAEALAANAGALITTPASLLELPGNQTQAEVTGMDGSQVGQDGEVDQDGGHGNQQVSPQVVLLGQDQSLHTMQVPVTIALTPIDPPSPADNQQQTHLQLQMPVQFVQTGQQLQQQPPIQQLTLHSSSVVTQHQPQLQHMQPYSSHQQSQGQTQILQMTFQPVSQSQTHVQQIPILTSSQQLQTMQTAALSHPLLSTSQPQSQDPSSTSGNAFMLDNSVLSSSSPPCGSLQQAEVMRESSTVWEQAGQGDVQAEGSERHVQQVLL